MYIRTDLYIGIKVAIVYWYIRIEIPHAGSKLRDGIRSVRLY
nr:MAG TPA: hypothetical protein [Caudoviricetes sp.]